MGLKECVFEVKMNFQHIFGLCPKEAKNVKSTISSICEFDSRGESESIKYVAKPNFRLCPIKKKTFRIYAISLNAQEKMGSTINFGYISVEVEKKSLLIIAHPT